MLGRMLDLERVGLGDPTSIGEENKCQQERWVLKEVDCEIPY